MSLILSYGERDVRRSEDPLTFSNRTAECFCDFAASLPVMQISSFSRVLLLRRKTKAPRTSAVQMSDVLAAKQLAEKLGGVDAAKRALDLLGQLQQ